MGWRKLENGLKIAAGLLIAGEIDVPWICFRNGLKLETASDWLLEQNN